MVHDFSSSALLTYKGKILLYSPDLPTTGTPQLLWGFIGGEKTDSQSPDLAIHRKIKYTTKLDLKNIRRLGSSVDKTKDKYFYHGELTDHDVNSIERREGQRLEFFTLNELVKLTLSESTEGLLTEYKETVEELLVHN